jgi:hypothetical protein
VQAAMTVSGAFQNEAEPPAAELPR